VRDRRGEPQAIEDLSEPLERDLRIVEIAVREHGPLSEPDDVESGAHGSLVREGARVETIGLREPGERGCGRRKNRGCLRGGLAAAWPAPEHGEKHEQTGRHVGRSHVASIRSTYYKGVLPGAWSMPSAMTAWGIVGRGVFMRVVKYWSPVLLRSSPRTGRPTMAWAMASFPADIEGSPIVK
jgi:hypothetical protein